MRRDVYSGWLKLKGEEHNDTLISALNYADSLRRQRRFKEAKSLLRKTMPVARRVLGDNAEDTLKIRWIYAQTLCLDAGATLDDLREAVTTLAEAAQIARRVLGGAHPETAKMEENLQYIRATLGVREAGET